MTRFFIEKLWRVLQLIVGAERVQHSEDLNYIWTWNNWSGLNTFPQEDILTSERYRELLTNFVKYL